MKKIVPWVLAGCLAFGSAQARELTEDERLDYMGYQYQCILGDFLWQFHSDIEDGFLSIDEQKSLFLRVDRSITATRNYRRVHPKASPEYEQGRYDMQNILSDKGERLYGLLNENLNGFDLCTTSLENYLRRDFVRAEVETNISNKEFVYLGTCVLLAGGLISFALRYDPEPSKDL